MMIGSDVDVVVIGGGPAGATAAGLLAAWGRSTVLVHGESETPSLAESLPASTRKLLRFLGQLDTVEAARFHPNHGNISHWAEKDAVAATTAAGYHVSRTVFDRVLRDHAQSRGVRMLPGHVRRVEFTTPVLVECATANEVIRVAGRFVLDCSGRAGVIARRGLRRLDAGYRTLAVAAEWKIDAWPAAELTQTVVDSYGSGWAWSVPLSSSTRQCTVMVDADRTTIRKRQLQRLYADELRRARSISSRLVEGKQNGPVWACDASVYDCTRAFEGDVLLVGDAASFVEALSSGGVKKALSSAWTAAVVVNTCLATPSMRAAAFELHDRRERHVFIEYARRSAAFFREAASVYDNPFWSSRASARGPIVNDCGPSDLDLQRDADLRRTYEQLRDASGLDLVAGQRLRLEETAVIEGREVVLREGVVVPGWNVPLRFVAGINLPELIRAAVACSDIPSLLTTYHRLVSVADPRDLLTALSLLVTRGVLSRYSPTT